MQTTCYHFVAYKS